MLAMAILTGKVEAQSSEQQTMRSQARSSIPSDAELDKLGMQKLAEMTAMSRHSESCPDVPDEWSASFLILLMKNTPPEDQVEAEERKVLALRDKIGNTRWCHLFSVEMQEAYIIVQSIMQRESP
jgi:hypothetical protein